MNENTPQSSIVHNTVLTIITIASLGAITESLLRRWEFWVPPLIIFGVFACWFIHISQYGNEINRENYYIIFSMLVAFFHGVHGTSLFDVIVIFTLLMVAVSLLNRKELLFILLVEYFIITLIQIIITIKTKNIELDMYNTLRIVLHVIAVICIYKVLGELIKIAYKDKDELQKRNIERENEKLEMEDFMVNISHELRTPVNVINGLSEIILKKEEREDVASIKEAGIRLSQQIEDIQDYSEIQRGNVLLEEDKYMITSLLNDIIVEYNLKENRKKLDFIVDLDPDVPAMLIGDVNKINKIIRHLLSNAIKYTVKGGIYLKVYSIKRDYGVNLIIEITDTGIGMDKKDIEKISKGMYQIDKKRNRSTGGIGLGLPIVYGFVRAMKGFVAIESAKKKGTSIRISIAQEIVDPSPCLTINNDNNINVIFYIIPEKYKVEKVREFYKDTATNMATALRTNLYFTPSISEVKALLERGNITHIFTGYEEYSSDPDYFDELVKNGIVVAVSAPEGFSAKEDSGVIVMPKPLYAVPVVNIFSGNINYIKVTSDINYSKPELEGIRALIVDDEPMNLVVASGIFKEYKMIIDTALSGKESIDKFTDNEYDVIFMDHMMPGMDGVEAMKKIKDIAAEHGRTIKVVALTANAVSGAREMFINEGFDGFISKPINIKDFERTMNKVFSGNALKRGGDRA